MPADKRRNFYEMDKTSHDKLYTENITKTYKKTNHQIYDTINTEAKSTEKDLGIEDKVKYLAKNPAFITLKDRKDDFANHPKCRLINSAKPELGKASKTLIETINKKVREFTNVNQWHNTDDVINWFNNIEDKQKCTFTQFDIEEFYPSISKDLLENSLQHARKYTNISESTQKIVMHARKSLLFTNTEHWVKKNGNQDFDVTMGSYDGAELCELVGLFILQTLSEKYGKNVSGLYRDDGLCCFRNVSGPESERIKKDLVKLFKEKFNLKITIQTNLKVVDFLDVTFNLTNETYQPYSKPNGQPVYINVHSNHPPNIIKRIPKMISDRMNKISSNKTIFERAAPYYNDALAASGYKETISFDNSKQNHKRTRSRKVIWFNPPFSINVKTDVARKFLKIVGKNFPRNHKLRKLFNKNTLKVSYSCLPNMSSIISSHNKKVLSNNITQNDITCNCRQKELCPLKGKCQDKNVIYLCNVKTQENQEGSNYIGLTENNFKDRWNQHKHTFKYENKANSTELSKHVWALKKNGIEPTLSWEIIDHAIPYKSGGKTCNLCLTEKYHIITSKLKLLNKRSELVSTCRHVNKYLLKNIKTLPPDPS